MVLLSIDTSTRVCSVALHQNGKLLACYELLTEKSHSGMLTSLVQDIVHQSGFTLSQVDAFVVAKGPGSYTGLRIGVSTAKGLCFGLDKPLIAINTLEAMAYQLKDFFSEEYLLCPMIDARRMEVYSAVFDKKMDVIQATEAKIIDENSFENLLNQRPIVFFGDGAAKCQAKLSHQNAIFPETLIYPSAKTVGYLALQSFEKGIFEDVITFEPFYLKEFFTLVNNE